MYAALVPPAEVLENVNDLLERMAERQIPGDPRGLRWSPPGDSHITLVFVASAADPGGLADALAEALAKQPPVAVGLSGAGAFPSPARAKHLWLGVDDPAGALPGLARGTRSAARQAGAQPETRPFSAHVTVARTRGADVNAEIDALSGFSAAPWVARSVTLFESHQGKHGSRHEPFAEIGLEGIAHRSQLPSQDQFPSRDQLPSRDQSRSPNQ